ncbi:aspartic proteinase nepenthesin-1-like [Impatiens glandulifera]|uniref:aspartic proteinase nepenthesin-1-like n=1 Tax=Impatiens glandulifera TaxID=253017 RepID=UPI001FB088FA|nr:aspartic proteinase nepenthesin-1-like [Impatiens glandulifera]
MASFPRFLTAAIILTILFFVSPSNSTSRGPLLNHQLTYKENTGFRVSLTHVDSGANFTTFERLQRAMKRGNNRLNQLNGLMASSDDLSSLVYPGNGEFLMNLSIGTPPTEFIAIMDTGSDLIWTQCRPCQNCYDQSTPIFDPQGSSSFLKLSCYSHQCGELPSSVCRSDGCEYTYTYGDYSSTQGIMATETFTFGNISVANLGFGCGEDNQGNGFTQGTGLVGFGRGPLSLVSQLREPAFSYCFTSIYSMQTSTLLVGPLALNSIGTNVSRQKTTPIYTNPSRSSLYYIHLQGITVGTVSLPIERSSLAIRSDGSGGMIIDSGTTVTYLENSVFDLVKAEFINQVKFKVDDSGVTGFDLCFVVPNGTLYIQVPRLVFHFEDADVEFPANNYMQADSTLGLMCLIMDGSNGLSIFGNLMQQNIMVVHDLNKETISFIPTQCDKIRS